jgi:hypothetical protein
MKTRIVKISTGYVPQVKTGLWSGWAGVAKHTGSLFNIVEFQLRYCLHDTREHAEASLEYFLNVVKVKETDEALLRKG